MAVSKKQRSHSAIVSRIINNELLNKPHRRPARERLFVMGCGASKVTPQSTDAKCLQVNGDGKAVEVEPASNGHANGYVNRQNLKSSKRKDSDSKPSISELNGNVPTKSQGNKDVSSHQALEETRHLSIGSGGKS